MFVYEAGYGVNDILVSEMCIIIIIIPKRVITNQVITTYQRGYETLLSTVL
jgi:hypothetical protein